MGNRYGKHHDHPLGWIVLSDIGMPVSYQNIPRLLEISDLGTIGSWNIQPCGSDNPADPITATRRLYVGCSEDLVGLSNTGISAHLSIQPHASMSQITFFFSFDSWRHRLPIDYFPLP